MFSEDAHVAGSARLFKGSFGVRLSPHKMARILEDPALFVVCSSWCW